MEGFGRKEERFSSGAKNTPTGESANDCPKRQRKTPNTLYFHQRSDPKYTEGHVQDDVFFLKTAVIKGNNF